LTKAAPPRRQNRLMADKIPEGIPVVEISAVGMQGPRGLRGKSAYEIALDYGFEGTEQDWLNSLGGGGGGSEFGIPAGGTVTQVLTKLSNGDYDAGWVDPPLGGGASSTAILPMTTVVAGEPGLVWSEDNEAITTEVPL
jgi:hypothetical protein